MYRPPFHRQVYPWVFVTLFFTLAPVLVFYSSGYRYNAKKGQIERNGTLIIDTTPRAATIFLDNQRMLDVTPMTYQNIAPGSHRLRLERAQYHSWEKTLEIRPEQVTFAHQVRLWKNTDPTFLLAGTFLKARRQTATSLVLLQEFATSTELTSWPKSFPVFTLATTTWPEVPTLRTSPGDAAVLIGGDTRLLPTWILPANNANTLQTLPKGEYWWSDRDLLGTENASQFSYDLATNRLTREPLPKQVLAKDTNVTLEASTSTLPGLRLLRIGTQVAALPSGHWTFFDRRSNRLVLKDGRRWLWCLLQRPITCQVADGLEITWLDDRPDSLALIHDENSVWLWKFGLAPSLVWRQSDPIRNAVWHKSGSSIFVASEHAIFALELDDRDGRIVTPLATFDEVSDLDLLGTTLYISAKKGTQSGLWALPIE